MKTHTCNHKPLGSEWLHCYMVHVVDTFTLHLAI